MQQPFVENNVQLRRFGPAKDLLPRETRCDSSFDFVFGDVLVDSTDQGVRVTPTAVSA